MLETFGQCADSSLCPHRTYRGSNGALARPLGLWLVVLVVVVALALGTGGLEASTFNVTTNADSGASSLRRQWLMRVPVIRSPLMLTWAPSP